MLDLNNSLSLLKDGIYSPGEFRLEWVLKNAPLLQNISFHVFDPKYKNQLVYSLVSYKTDFNSITKFNLAIKFKYYNNHMFLDSEVDEISSYVTKYHKYITMNTILDGIILYLNSG